MSRPMTIGLASFVLALLAACSSDPEEQQSATTSTPLESLSLVESTRARGDAARAAQLQTMECLDERGFPSTLQADGTLRTPVNPEQNETFLAASEECMREVDYGAAASPLTDLELRWLYDANVAAYECLQAEGHSPSEPVSFEVYVDAERSGVMPWSPFEVEGREGGLPQSTCQRPNLADAAKTSP